MATRVRNLCVNCGKPVAVRTLTEGLIHVTYLPDGRFAAAAKYACESGGTVAEAR